MTMKMYSRLYLSPGTSQNFNDIITSDIVEVRVPQLEQQSPNVMLLNLSQE